MTEKFIDLTDNVSDLIVRPWIDNKDIVDKLVSYLDRISQIVWKEFENVEDTNAIGYIKEQIELTWYYNCFQNIDVIRKSWCDIRLTLMILAIIMGEYDDTNRN